MHSEKTLNDETTVSIFKLYFKSPKHQNKGGKKTRISPFQDHILLISEVYLMLWT